MAQRSTLTMDLNSRTLLFMYIHRRHLSDLTHWGECKIKMVSITSHNVGEKDVDNQDIILQILFEQMSGCSPHWAGIVLVKVTSTRMAMSRRFDNCKQVLLGCAHGSHGSKISHTCGTWPFAQTWLCPFLCWTKGTHAVTNPATSPCWWPRRLQGNRSTLLSDYLDKAVANSSIALVLCHRQWTFLALPVTTWYRKSSFPFENQKIKEINPYSPQNQ
jgi:hypothetical protein